MRLEHRKAYFDYEILERIESGIQLTGAEVKSLTAGHGTLEGSFVRIIGNEAYLVNAQIFPYLYARPPAGAAGYDPKRTRKLLLHKKQIQSLQSKIDSANLTLVPLVWYTRGHKLKLEIGLARGRKQYEKREKKRREDIKRELERDFRGKIK